MTASHGICLTAYLGVNRYLALQAVKALMSTMLKVDNMHIPTSLNNVAQHFLQLATLGSPATASHVSDFT